MVTKGVLLMGLLVDLLSLAPESGIESTARLGPASTRLCAYQGQALWTLTHTPRDQALGQSFFAPPDFS